MSLNCSSDPNLASSCFAISTVSPSNCVSHPPKNDDNIDVPTDSSHTENQVSGDCSNLGTASGGSSDINNRGCGGGRGRDRGCGRGRVRGRGCGRGRGCNNTNPAIDPDSTDLSSPRSPIGASIRASNNSNDSSNESGEDSDGDWVESNAPIPVFGFDSSRCGFQKTITDDPLECFKLFWTQDITDILVQSMNNYMNLLSTTQRPKRQHARISEPTLTNEEEVYKFLGLTMLAAQVKKPTIRHSFSTDPQYYSPIFGRVMSGRRFETLLRCFSCDKGTSNLPTAPTNNQPSNTAQQKVRKGKKKKEESEPEPEPDRLTKVKPILQILLKNFQELYRPGEQLSLDESLLLYRGRLVFRQYIKNKKKNMV